MSGYLSAILWVEDSDGNRIDVAQPDGSHLNTIVKLGDDLDYTLTPRGGFQVIEINPAAATPTQPPGASLIWRDAGTTSTGVYNSWTTIKVAIAAQVAGLYQIQLDGTDNSGHCNIDSGFSAGAAIEFSGSSSSAQTPTAILIADGSFGLAMTQAVFRRVALISLNTIGGGPWQLTAETTIWLEEESAVGSFTTSPVWLAGNGMLLTVYVGPGCIIGDGGAGGSVVKATGTGGAVLYVAANGHIQANTLAGNGTISVVLEPGAECSTTQPGFTGTLQIGRIGPWSIPFTNSLGTSAKHIMQAANNGAIDIAIVPTTAFDAGTALAISYKGTPIANSPFPLDDVNSPTRLSTPLPAGASGGSLTYALTQASPGGGAAILLLNGYTSPTGYQ